MNSKSHFLICIYYAVIILGCSKGFAQKKQDSTFIKLKGVVVVGRNPISEKYSVRILEKMDIYSNPAANADPLKATVTLPFSTNVDEMANPSLRGGNADRSRVYINGAPIINPVRFALNNGLGNFSIFNPEIIEKQYVYASNPPLSFGNSSAGLVEIETTRQLDKNSDIQMALSLANMGLMFNKNIANKGFIQLYGNYQFDRGYIQLNKESLSNLKGFRTTDVGLNSKWNISKNLTWNTFNYMINEGYNFLNSSFNLTAEASASKKRFFSINNVDYTKKWAKIRFVSMLDYSSSNFEYGNIVSNTIGHQYFNALHIKTAFSSKITGQYGVESSIYTNIFRELVPMYYYAQSINSPSIPRNQKADFYYVEPYVYVNAVIRKNLGVSAAIRQNLIKTSSTKRFTSYQFATNYELNNRNRFLLSAGAYHSYATPNYFTRSYSLLRSKQISLDYYYYGSHLDITAAIYHKNDGGDFTANDFERFNKITTKGAELGISFPFWNYFRLNASNSYVQQHQYFNSQKYNTSLNLKYFIKSQLIYKHPEIATFSILYSTRPGNHYTEVIGGNFQPTANDFMPKFGVSYANTFSRYSRFDLNINKLIPLKKSYIIAFASINNMLNTKNESDVLYNSDYSSKYFQFFQQRTLYMGVQVRL